jgi:phospholipid-binding lipoprotein MlaA
MRGRLLSVRRALTALGIATACLATPSLAYAQDVAADPWEGFNRGLFAVNETIDKAVLEPVARGYRAVTPTFLREGVSNFLRNLRSPVIFANDVLQGEPSRAGVTAARFGVNTTIGIGGIFDPASPMGLERHDEDFGQTLGVWGVDAGPYLFLPLLGPSSVRDTVGSVVDLAFDPLNWAKFDEADDVRAGRVVLTGLAARESALDAVDEVRRTSLDPYASIRTSYDLLRQSAIQNGRPSVQDLPDFGTIPDDGGAPPQQAPDPAPTSLYQTPKGDAQ